MKGKPSHHRTMRGQPIDFGRLRIANGRKKAVGNAGVNARGDQLTSSGIVLKTQEQIEKDWQVKKANKAASLGMEPNFDEMQHEVRTPAAAGINDRPKTKKKQRVDNDFDS